MQYKQTSYSYCLTYKTVISRSYKTRTTMQDMVQIYDYTVPVKKKNLGYRKT